MDLSAEKGGAGGNHRPVSFSAVWQTVWGGFRRLVEFFTITESDRIKAGIFIRRRGA